MAVLKNFPQLEKTTVSRNEKADIRFLTFFLECGKYYGATPVRGPKNRYSPKIHRGIFLTLLLLFVALSCMSLPTPNTILDLLQIIWQLTDIGFLCSSIYQPNSSTAENWDRLLGYLSAMEELLVSLRFRSQAKLTTILVQISSICGCSALLIAWNVFYLFQDWTGPPNFASFGWLIVNIYVTTFIALIFLLTKILRVRYRHIDSQIAKRLRKKGEFEADFENTIALLRTMHEVVKLMNKIFGWQFFFFVNVMIIRVVHSCFVAVFFLNPSNAGKQVETILYVMALILLVLPCDQLEETGKNIVRTCYAMHLKTTDERTRDRLLDLGRYAEDWKPTLSAAGFFAVKKECLNSAFENFVTYLVVSIQFKMSLDADN